MKNKTSKITWLVIFLLGLFTANFGWADNLTGSVFSGQAKSSKSGTVWPAVMKIVLHDQASGRVEGEIEWTSLNAVHKITGQLTGSTFTFKEVDYIKKGSANLNCEYTSTFSNSEISGTWKDPNSDYGTFQLTRQTNPVTAAVNSFAGSVFSGQAKSSKSGTVWPAVLKIVSYDPSSGRVEGEIEWTSLNAVHKITGQLTGSKFTFTEVDYIKKGSANLNCEYTSTFSNGEISGTWKDPNSDYGAFQLSKKTNPASAGTGTFAGSVFSGQAKSSKSGTVWPSVLKIVSYDQASGSVEGEIEWPSLNAIHKITGQLNGSKFTFKEVDYIKKGSANLNCEYTSTFSDGEISGTWKDPNSDYGTFLLTKK